MMESRSSPMGAREHAFHRPIYGAASILILILLATSAVAQDSIISNVELCNGRDRSSPEPQIRGCSEVIKASTLVTLKCWRSLTTIAAMHIPAKGNTTWLWTIITNR